MYIEYIVVEYFIGSLMFSYWLGFLKNKNITTVGDGNPGAFNLMISTSKKIGFLGFLLDFLKGYLPITFFINSGLVTGYATVPIALAPIVGHIFSPFLKFKGGKGLSVSFGVWTALLSIYFSVVFLIILELLHFIIAKYNDKYPFFQKLEQIRAIFLMTLLSAFLIIMQYPMVILCIWLINLILLISKNFNNVSTFIKCLKI